MKNDLISRQAIIDAINSYDFSFPEYMERFVTELRDAMKTDLIEDLKNMPSIQPVQEKVNKGNCPYCHEDSDGYTQVLEKNGHAVVRWEWNTGKWIILLSANGWKGKCEIEYCPMCGRRLDNDLDSV